MPIPRHLLDAGEDLSAPVEIYARHLQCTPPGSSPTWKPNSPTLPEKGGTSNVPESKTYCSMDLACKSFCSGSVQVKLELGHKATTRKKPTPEGFTHDWQMFVRGPEGSNIQHFVDRVIFHLHDSFPKPKRVVKEPPYMINESGYAGFNLPIEIYFKNKEEPKKIVFNYDLFLHTPNSPPVNHVRCEKLTFQNPTEEFRRKLIKAGGIGIPGPNDQSMASMPGEVKCTTSPTVIQTPESSQTFADLFGAPLVKPDSGHKKHKGHTSLKERAGGKNKATAEQVAAISPPSAKTPPSLTVNTATPPTTPSKESKPPNTPTKHGKEKGSKRPAEAAQSSESKKKRKEPPAMVDDVIRAKERGDKRERDKREKEKDEKEKKDKRKEKKSSSKDSKGKHKSSRKESSKSSKSAAVAEPKPPKAVTPPRVSPPTVPPVIVPEPLTTILDAKSLMKKGRKDDDMLSVGDMLNFDDESLDMEAILPPELLAPYVGACSPASTLSFSSLKETAGAGAGGGSGGGSGPLGALLAEMEDEEEPLSPLPTTEMSPLHRIPPPLLEDKPEKQIRPDPPKEIPPPAPEIKPTGGKAKRKDRESRKSRSERRIKEASKENKDSSKEANKAKETIAKDLFREHNSEKDTEVDSRVPTLGEPENDFSDRDASNFIIPASIQTATAPNGESLNVLLEIQRRLMAMTDRDLVQQVVNVIEETGMYKISDATFDFDLCSLDSKTVKKLQACLEMPVC